MALPPLPDVPVLEAIAIGDKKEDGASIPVAIQCSSPEGQGLSDYVVKFYSALPMGVRGLARELYGALLGMLLGIDIPPAAIINIDPDLSETTSDPDIASRLQNSPGLNFGSKTIETDVGTFQYIPKGMLQVAGDIFAFDMLIQNLDRTHVKPNMLQTRTRLIAIDHEDKTFLCAAADILGIEPASNPWNDGGMEPYSASHRLLTELKGKELNFSGFFGQLELINPDILQQIEDRIPGEWAPNDVRQISDYLIEAVDNIPSLQRRLLEVLA